VYFADTGLEKPAKTVARQAGHMLSSIKEIDSMSRTLHAVYENGAFRPLEPVSCHEQERVLLTVQSIESGPDNFLDQEFLAYCDAQADDSVSLEDVWQVLAKIPGSLVDDIRAERDARSR
jgi:predicted DNA-binding antitoxin AbrB/MazE fold protein